jgi:hypothetical protein
VNIGGPEESALVTSQFHIDHDSPKGSTSDYVNSGRARSEGSLPIKTTQFSSIKHKSGIEGEQDSLTGARVNVVMNSHQLPQFSITLRRLRAT